MKPKPILFNTEMVRAILEGRKTQTRRAIKPQPVKEAIIFERFIETVDCGFEARFGNDISEAVCDRKPSYQPGDILWVRETWLKADDGFYYKADVKAPSESEDMRKAYGYKWKPSIFMPREAARIFLRVTNVSVERLQEITVDDCRLEGCCCSDCLQTGPHSPDCKCDTLFHNVWNDINAKRGYGWQTNPWVWVYEFERAEGMKC